MTKQLLVSAAALALSVTALADGHAKKAGNTVYGEFRGSLSMVNAENAAGTNVNESFSWNNNASRVGFKGSNDKGVFYKFEMGAATDTAGGGTALTTRKAWVGMKGKKWGKVKFGTGSTPYKSVAVKNDPFYDTSANGVTSITAVGATGATWGHSNMNNGFTASQLHYFSPVFAGVQVNLGTAFNDTAVSPDVSDDYNIGVKWSGFGATVGAQFLTLGNGTAAVAGNGTANTGIVNGSAGDKWMKIHASYGMGNWGANVNYEQFTDGVLTGQTAADETYMNINAWYKMDKHKFAAAFGSQKRDSTPAATTFDGTGINVGYWHLCDDNTNMYAVYSSSSTDDNAKMTTISLGINHSFDSML